MIRLRRSSRQRAARSTGALTLALVAAVIMAGCSTTEDARSNVAAGQPGFGTADEATAKLGSAAAPGEFPRTVTHAMGTVEIPAKPQRVVVLDTGELDSVLSLGITPVGMATTLGASPVPTYLADRLEGVASVGSIQEINLEAIAELRPDLILGSQLRVEKLYAQLAEIAPTVLSIRPGFPWKENHLLVGAALGMENEVTAALTSYADAIDRLKSEVEGEPTISLVRFLPDRLRLYGNKSLLGVILRDAGLARPAKQDIDDLAVEISAENIADADGSVIFYTSYGAPDATGETTVVNGAGWKALPAVAAGKSFRVNDDVWFLGLGPIGAELIVADLGKLLTPLP
ncbi:iron-siderophore ABC transporter substrate-binding protein [Nocardia uniformis]|uniref:Iron-siderophore ABC transporter substrate-binding protein n=1 Tax=Nocardia uniformis TaxID=53432 RepID=A0A849BXY4_9NOCA|nr:iron-siderophore ABC transporter substrate-binding protein [Nocardia uniformis]NNH68975.1 iron-siderophore ABC transporter substrate-binding protein [Nocardia uniformis]